MYRVSCIVLRRVFSLQVLSHPTPSSAMTSSPSNSPSQLPASQPQVNLRNPVPLSALQESQVQDLYHKRVRNHCSSEIKGCTIPFSDATVS